MTETQKLIFFLILRKFFTGPLYIEWSEEEEPAGVFTKPAGVFTKNIQKGYILCSDDIVMEVMGNHVEGFEIVSFPEDKVIADIKELYDTKLIDENLYQLMVGIVVTLDHEVIISFLRNFTKLPIRGGSTIIKFEDMTTEMKIQHDLLKYTKIVFKNFEIVHKRTIGNVKHLKVVSTKLQVEIATLIGNEDKGYVIVPDVPEELFNDYIFRTTMCSNELKSIIRQDVIEHLCSSRDKVYEPIKSWLRSRLNLPIV